MLNVKFGQIEALEGLYGRMCWIDGLHRSSRFYGTCRTCAAIAVVHRISVAQVQYSRFENFQIHYDRLRHSHGTGRAQRTWSKNP